MRLQDLFLVEHENVTFKHRGDARMVLAYHSVGNGTCFGGVRLLPYDAGERAAKDALRLSEAMTYKLALIDAPYGGCKAVVFIPKEGKTREFLLDAGRLIEEEAGKFISAIDFGFEPDDAKTIHETTQYILAIVDSEFGQSGVTTAHGVLEGIKTTLKYRFGSDEISGRSFAVQGLGSVGYALAKELADRGGDVYVADLDEKKLRDFKGIATVISPDEIIFSEVDVLAPCGPAYVINEDTIPKLRCELIVGGANCQIEDEVRDDQMLFERGILIAPDYAVNAGGVIQGIEELTGGSLRKAVERLTIISRNLNEIYKESREIGIGTYQTAKKIALAKISARPS